VEPVPPATVGPYTLLRVLGDGATGRVLLARTEKGARVALKVFRPELAVYAPFRARLRTEIEAAARVRSPRVVAVVDADPDADRPWLATEYVQAPPLHEVLAERGPLGAPAARRLGIGLAEAIAALRAAGVVHGDLKPGDILLGPDGPHVTDVGLARAAAATPLTRGGALVGTLGYLAPEQVLDGAAVPASDIFALGAVLLFAATWRRPFGDGDATSVLHRVLHGDPDLSGLAPDLATVVAACLQRDPHHRPGPDQVRQTLLVADRAEPEVRPLAAAGPPSRSRAAPRPVPVPGRERPVPGLSRGRRVAAALGVAVSLVALLAVTTADTIGTPPPSIPTVWAEFR
jgi:eukaryotic-like serine/threonine-protein kinase